MAGSVRSVGAAAGGPAAWPELPLAGWQATYATLHWWQVALYVTPRGLTTSAIPSGTRTFAVNEAAADLGRWDRAALDRAGPSGGTP